PERENSTARGRMPVLYVQNLGDPVRDVTSAPSPVSSHPSTREGGWPEMNLWEAHTIFAKFWDGTNCQHDRKCYYLVGVRSRRLDSRKLCACWMRSVRGRVLTVPPRAKMLYSDMLAHVGRA